MCESVGTILALLQTLGRESSSSCMPPLLTLSLHAPPPFPSCFFCMFYLEPLDSSSSLAITAIRICLFICLLALINPFAFFVCLKGGVRGGGKAKEKEGGPLILSVHETKRITTW